MSVIQVIQNKKHSAMSQNKTVIPGLSGSADGNAGGFGPAPDFYSRNGRVSGRGTVVSDMSSDTSAGSPTGAGQQAAAPKYIVSGKPVVGFAYSISRSPVGEFWPLHVGQNTIGKDPECDIVLNEGTVSGEHAVLVVRKMKNPEKVIASISDARSTNGTMINGVSLGFQAEECKNGDIITIGDNYELYITLVDVAELGLKVSENFVHIDDVPEPGNIGFTDMPSPFVPGGTVGADGQAVQYNTGGTVGI